MRPQWLEEYQNRILKKFEYRNLNGTFAKGNPGGPGRPRIDYLKRAGIYRKIPLEQMDPQTREISLRAERGDYKALKAIKDSLNNCPSAIKNGENRKSNSLEGNKSCSWEQK
jgi:hypothetical protein